MGKHRELEGIGAAPPPAGESAEGCAIEILSRFQAIISKPAMGQAHHLGAGIIRALEELDLHSPDTMLVLDDGCSLMPWRPGSPA